MESIRAAMTEVRDRLSHEPWALVVFDRLVHALTERSDVALAVSGSLASGPIDSWSDIDLEVILPQGSDVQRRLEWTLSIAQSVATPLCHFPASHVGLDQLRVFFFSERDHVVKADLYVVELSAYLNLTGPRLVFDPGFVSEARGVVPGPPKPKQPDFEDLHMKFCGWIWYTLAKIERGELLEALDSLQVMRTRALLPSLQCIHGLPYEGNRRLEMRLPPGVLASVNETVARSVEPGELRRSLLELVRLFQRLQPGVSERLGRDHQLAHLEAMIHQVNTHWKCV